MKRNDPVFPGVNYSLRSLLESSDILQNAPNFSKYFCLKNLVSVLFIMFFLVTSALATNGHLAFDL